MDESRTIKDSAIEIITRWKVNAIMAEKATS